MARKYFNDLLVTGKVLEKIYINSTDIEFAQFYNKELALRLNSYSNESKIMKDIKFENLAFEVDEVFQAMEVKKEAYFSTNHKEIAESDQEVLKKLKIQNENLNNEVKKLKS